MAAASFTATLTLTGAMEATTTEVAAVATALAPSGTVSASAVVIEQIGGSPMAIAGGMNASVTSPINISAAMDVTGAMSAPNAIPEQFISASMGVTGGISAALLAVDVEKAQLSISAAMGAASILPEQFIAAAMGVTGGMSERALEVEVFSSALSVNAGMAAGISEGQKYASASLAISGSMSASVSERELIAADLNPSIGLNASMTGGGGIAQQVAAQFGIVGGMNASVNPLGKQIPATALTIDGRLTADATAVGVVGMGAALQINAKMIADLGIFLRPILANGRWRIVYDREALFVSPVLGEPSELSDGLEPLVNEEGFVLFFDSALARKEVSMTFVKPSGSRLVLDAGLVWSGVDEIVGARTPQRTFVAHVFRGGELDESGEWRVYLSRVEDGSAETGMARFSVRES